ncbi:MAG: VWA domain-containing protein, partial [Candidatus Bipolaricaulota bacterium]
MSLLLPWALAWAAASSAVVLLYMLRRRERQLPVSALFLWEQVPPDAMSRLARWLPRADLLLWAQNFIVLLMALALAAPVVIRARPAGATALIVDTSLKLAPEGRLEEARDEARKLVRESAGPWALIGWGDPPELLVGPTDREEEIMAGINRLSYNLTSPPPLSRARALVPQGWDRVVVISGAPPKDADVEAVALSPVDNLAIEAFAARAQPDGSAYQALVRVRNDGPGYEDVVV